MQLVTHEEFGENVRQIRKEDGMTQEQLARKSRLSQSVIARIESGERRVNVEEFQQVLHALGMTDPNDLLYPEPPGRHTGSETEVLEQLDPVQPEHVAGFGTYKEWLMARKDLFLNGELDFVQGCLMVGPPGTGKSISARLAGALYDCPIYRVKTDRVLSLYVGESSARLRRALEQAEDNSPCVLLFDEIERLSTTLDDVAAERLLGMLLGWLNDCDRPILTVVTSNDLKELPPELKRRGRLDEIFACGLPALETKIDLLKAHFARHNIPEAIIPNGDSIRSDTDRLEQFDKVTDRYSQAEMGAVVQEALIQAGGDPENVTWQDVMDAAESMRAQAKLEYKDVEQTIEWCKKYGTWVD